MAKTTKDEPKKIHVACINYMIDQNEPSRPAPETLEIGKIKQGLIELWKEGVYESDLTDTQWKKGKFNICAEDNFGDIMVSFTEMDDILLFVSFDPKDKDKAFRELGL